MLAKPDMRFRRLRDKGSRDFTLACNIIDASRICHVGFSLEEQTYVVPMALARDGKQVLLHGSVASRLMKSLSGGLQCCVTVTLFDGLVLARSAFNSSMHYRCVMIFGQAKLIDQADEKNRGMNVMTEQLMPGRLKELRPSTRKELNATTLLTIPLETFTVKVSDGPADDPAKDLDEPVWAGVLPVNLTAGKPQTDPEMKKKIALPGYLKEWTFN